MSELELVPEVEAYFCAADYISGGDIIRKYEYAKDKTRKKRLKKKYLLKKILFLKMVNQLTQNGQIIRIQKV